MTVRGMAQYEWQAYPPNVDALVWAHPVRLDPDNEHARAMVAEALYMWARLPVRDGSLGLFHDAQRTALTGLLAYMSGYTGGSDGPR